MDSDLRPVGTDRLAGTVTNRQTYALEDAVMAFGRQVYLLGTLAPGATIRVELASDRNLAGLLRDRSAGFATVQPANRNAEIKRSDLLMTLMFHESEGTRINDSALTNVALQDLDLTGQLLLDRPMLVAKIKRPGAQLVLDNAPSTPKIDQTTMLRIILPLNRTPATKRMTAAPSRAAEDPAGLPAGR